MRRASVAFLIYFFLTVPDDFFTSAHREPDRAIPGRPGRPLHASLSPRSPEQSASQQETAPKSREPGCNEQERENPSDSRLPATPNLQGSITAVRHSPNPPGQRSNDPCSGQPPPAKRKQRSERKPGPENQKKQSACAHPLTLRPRHHPATCPLQSGYRNARRSRLPATTPQAETSPAITAYATAGE